MRKIFKYFVFIFITVSVFSQLIPILEAQARPGGGSSYRSGGSRSYSSGSSGRSTYSGGGSRVYTSSGGSSDASDIIFNIIIFIIVIAVFSAFQKGKQKLQQAGFTVYADRGEEIKQRKLYISQQIEAIKQRDSDFSKILFLDFVNSLYNKFYTYLNENKITTLRPFISEAEINDAKINYPGKINEIVVGSIDIISIESDQFNDYITVDIDANYTVWHGSKGIRYLIIERWKFFRQKGILSKPPEVMRGVSCPNCAGPTDFTDAGECNYCKTFINKGDMQWALQSRYETTKEQFVTTLGGTNQQEEGTQSPTVVDKNIDYLKSFYMQRNNLDEWQNFWEGFKENIVNTYFFNIYNSWSENRLLEVRRLLSDRLYESFSFWINNYKRDGLVNRLENIKIHKIQLANIDIDKYYDSITVRVFASSFDYIQNSSGKVVSGSKSYERKFSEYWTFIKKSGLSIDENQTNIKQCPNCSAPADNIGQAGKCEYCGSKISTGDFSWVLAIITQDEVYQG